MLHVSCRFSWEDFFENVDNPNPKTVSKHISFSSGSKVHVSYSFVSYVYSTTANSVIFFYTTSNESYLLVEKTTFLHVRSKGAGGSIYFQQKGHCILSMICAFNSSTISDSYQFAYILVSGEGYENECHDCSISRADNPNYDRNLCQVRGTVITQGVNMSHNRCREYPGNNIYPTSSASSTFAGFVSYSTFTNCTAMESGIVHWSWNDNYTSQNKVTSVNVVDNTQNETSATNGVISLGCKVTIDNSCITGNDGKYLFRQLNNYESILRNCTIDSGYSVSGKLPTVINCPSTTFINVIPFINDAVCDVVIGINKGKLTNSVVHTCKPNRKLSLGLTRMAQFVFLLNILPSNTSDIW